MSARVKLVNKREITFPHKSRGRVVGTDHRTIHDGYQASCAEHEWAEPVTQFLPVATAQAACHNDEEHHLGSGATA
jgi:hypothetical protein